MSDPFERAQLPQGEFDVPLMISDVMFNADGSLGYNDNGHKGLWGDIIMVNGVPWPTMKVKPRVYRFRVLVASISRSYRPTLSTGDPVYIVGTDAGMTPKVQAVASWRQGTAERYEILIDFRKYKVGQMVELRNLATRTTSTSPTPTRSCGSRWWPTPARPPSTHPHHAGRRRCRNAAKGGIATMSLTPAMAVAKRELKVERVHGNGPSTASPGRMSRSPGSPSCSATPSRSTSSSGRSPTLPAAGSIPCTST